MVSTVGDSTDHVLRLSPLKKGSATRMSIDIAKASLRELGEMDGDRIIIGEIDDKLASLPSFGMNSLRKKLKVIGVKHNF